MEKEGVDARKGKDQPAVALILATADLRLCRAVRNMIRDMSHAHGRDSSRPTVSGGSRDISSALYVSGGYADFNSYTSRGLVKKNNGAAVELTPRQSENGMRDTSSGG